MSTQDAVAQPTMRQVLINGCYGAFKIPNNIRDAIFDLHPPPSEFWRKMPQPLCDEERDLTSDEDSYILVEEYEEYLAGYKRIKGWHINKHNRTAGSHAVTENTITYGDGIVWSIYPQGHIWRTHPDVIRLCKERGYIGKLFDNTVLEIAEYPDGYGFRIREYDGMESLTAIPPTVKVIGDMIRIINDGDRSNLNPFTEKLLKGEVSAWRFVHAPIP